MTRIQDSRFCLNAFSPNILIIYPYFNVLYGEVNSRNHQAYTLEVARQSTMFLYSLHEVKNLK